MRTTTTLITGLVILVSPLLTINAQEKLISPELMLWTENGKASDSFTFEMTSTSSIIWESHRTGHYFVHITTDPKYVDPGDITLPGYSHGNDGWNSDKYPTEDPEYGPLLGRGYYQLKVAQTGKTLVVDCYGTDFQGDVTIIYDCKDDVFKVNGNPESYINLYDDPATGLQPTPPRNFRCTNAGQTGQHPQLMWSVPEAPDISSNNFRYKIYRSQGTDPFTAVASDLTTTSWTDEGVTIESNGNHFAYYVVAYTNQSPSSNFSNYAYIRGLHSQKSLPEITESNFPANKNQNPGDMILTIHPNPFNPTTTISYHFPQDGYVRLTVYNLTGQTIADLVNSRKSAGIYQINFNGQALSAGIYLVRLQFGSQVLSRKILLFK